MTAKDAAQAMAGEAPGTLPGPISTANNDGYYNDKVVLQFSVATVIWGIVGIRNVDMEAAGGSRDDVPAPRVVGGYPHTPGFDERAHLEAVIAHGAPPIPIERRILLGD
jgi:hypothetical protein